jgi:hypothetical protein
MPNSPNAPKEPGFDSDKLFRYFDGLSLDPWRQRREVIALQAANVAMRGGEDPQVKPKPNSFFIRVDAAINALDGFEDLQDSFLDEVIGQLIEKFGSQGLETFES